MVVMNNPVKERAENNSDTNTNPASESFIRYVFIKAPQGCLQQPWMSNLWILFLGEWLLLFERRLVFCLGGNRWKLPLMDKRTKHRDVQMFAVRGRPQWRKMSVFMTRICSPDRLHYQMGFGSACVAETNSLMLSQKGLLSIHIVIKITTQTCWYPLAFHLPNNWNLVSAVAFAGNQGNTEWHLSSRSTGRTHQRRPERVLAESTWDWHSYYRFCEVLQTETW